MGCHPEEQSWQLIELESYSLMEWQQLVGFIVSPWIKLLPWWLSHSLAQNHQQYHWDRAHTDWHLNSYICLLQSPREAQCHWSISFWIQSSCSCSCIQLLVWIIQSKLQSYRSQTWILLNLRSYHGKLFAQACQRISSWREPVFSDALVSWCWRCGEGFRWRKFDL